MVGAGGSRLHLGENDLPFVTLTPEQSRLNFVTSRANILLL